MLRHFQKKIVPVKVWLLGIFLLTMECAYSQKVSLSVKEAALEKVLQDIGRQAGYDFFYRQQWLEQAKPVTIRAKDEEFTDVLRRIFRDQPFTFRRPQPYP